MFVINFNIKRNDFINNSLRLNLLDKFWHVYREEFEYVKKQPYLVDILFSVRRCTCCNCS